MKAQKTNIEFLTEWMEFSRTGAMAQFFVVQAISYYAQRVLQDQDKLREDMKSNFINPEAWIAVAKEWEQKSKEQYGH